MSVLINLIMKTVILYKYIEIIIVDLDVFSASHLISVLLALNSLFNFWWNKNNKDTLFIIKCKTHW